MLTDDRIILVTGSNGRIGEAVMRRFSGRFASVIGTDRSAPEPLPGCVYVPIEVTSDDSVREGLTAIREHHGNRIASVIHLAAYYDFFGKPSPKYEDITVSGTRRMLVALHELDFEVEQFLFSSTMLVHGPTEPGVFINEDSPIEATWAYPKSKVRTEQVIRDERGTIPAVLMRIAGVYDDGGHTIPIAGQVKRIQEREFASNFYSGSTAHAQAFVHMDDLVDAIEQAVERRAELPKEFAVLIGEPDALSYDELQHTIARLLFGKSSETISIPTFLAPFSKLGAFILEHLPGADPFLRPWMIDRANDHYALDISRARELLGWNPKRSLRNTLPTIIADVKADRLGWYKENGLKAKLSRTERATLAPPNANANA
jgi:nucleoside-diphosphate-sugar epimerase